MTPGDSRPPAVVLDECIRRWRGALNAPVAVIEAGIWQAARSLGDYSLVGCTVGPGFEFEDFRFVAALPGHAAHFAVELAPFAQLL